MNETIKQKLCKNVILIEQLYKLDRNEKQQIIKELLKDKSQRQLAKELNIPHSTIHDWVSLRQNNTETDTHISFMMFYRKIKSLRPEDITDWGRIEMIKEKLEELLNSRIKIQTELQ